jgi:hypothetical protein
MTRTKLIAVCACLAAAKPLAAQHSGSVNVTDPPGRATVTHLAGACFAG